MPESNFPGVQVKCYVKVTRVAEAVALTDVQLASMDKDKDAIVHARVALQV